MKVRDTRRFSSFPIAMLDVETTDLSPYGGRVTEVACVVMAPNGGEVMQSCSWLCNPGVEIPEVVVNLTGITNEMVAEAKTFGEVLHGLCTMIPNDCIVAAYNKRFDRAFLGAEVARTGRPAPWWLTNDVDWFDPYVWIRVAEPYAKGKGRYKLPIVAARWGVEVKTSHRALADVETSLELIRQRLLPGFGCFKPLDKEEVWKVMMQQQIHQASQDARFLQWLIERPTLPPREPDGELGMLPQLFPELTR